MSTNSTNIFQLEVDKPYTVLASSGMDELWLDREASRELNTYRNFNEFALPVEPIIYPKDPMNPTNDELNDGFIFTEKTEKQFTARHSLFNAWHGIANNAWYQLYGNTPLFDTPATREIIRMRSDCSVKALVKESELGHMGRAIYNYSDFMFCTHLGKISNNYLITLRRFPYPCGDHINYTLQGDNPDEYNGHAPDIGRLVTWMGTPGNDMSGILKYKVLMPYKDMSAQIQEASGTDGQDGFLGGMMSLASKSNQSKVVRGIGGGGAINATRSILSSFDKRGKTLGGMMKGPSNTEWAYHRDQSKAYGPVDSIAKTSIRSGPEDGGLEFEHPISLTFDYTMRAYDGINAKAAFLDLLGNILAVTYTDAGFWGGAIHGSGAGQSNAFANLPIFNMKDPISISGIIDAGLASIKDIGSTFNNGSPINGISDLLNAAKNLGKGMLNAGVGSFLNSIGRPVKQGMNSLLNQAPTGLWHLTVGNPRHPIMSMGNMKLTSVEIEHYGPLGLDDFPTGIKVTISLTHAMPRDRMMIENMYNSGDNRIYFSLGRRAYEIWAEAEELGTGVKNTTTPAELINVLDNQEVDKNTQEIANDKEITRNRWLKYFGVTDSETINRVSQEAHRGSQMKQNKSGEGSTPKP